jgi:hypothetical protein
VTSFLMEIQDSNAISMYLRILASCCRSAE